MQNPLDFAIGLLIALFLALFVYDLVVRGGGGGREGMDTQYTEYSGSDPMILGQQNAGNIAYLKQRVDEIAPLKTQISDLSARVDALTEQVNGLVQQQADYAVEISGGTGEPANITGV